MARDRAFGDVESYYTTGLTPQEVKIWLDEAELESRLVRTYGPDKPIQVPMLRTAAKSKQHHPDCFPNLFSLPKNSSLRSPPFSTDLQPLSKLPPAPEPSPSPESSPEPDPEPAYSKTSSPLPSAAPRGRTLLAEGFFNSVPVKAVADSGAGANVVSWDFVQSLGLTLDPKPAKTVQLPNGKKIRTLGQVRGDFQFSQEQQTTYPLLFLVLECAAHALVLGSRFLRATETFKAYPERLETIYTEDVPAISFLGEEQQEQLEGLMNEKPVKVVPDTGSDLMVMSPECAAQLGLRVDKSKQHRCKVRFVDGSEALTSGLVKNVWWTFIGPYHSFFYDFHVLKGLPVPAIVSSTFLERHNVFVNYDQWILEEKSGKEQVAVYGINFLGKCRGNKRTLEEQAREDRECLHHFSGSIRACVKTLTGFKHSHVLRPVFSDDARKRTGPT